jgi:hypothetical protein
MKVIRICPRSGKYQDIDIPSWTVETEAAYASGASLDSFTNLTNKEREYIRTGFYDEDNNGTNDDPESPVRPPVRRRRTKPASTD